MKRALAVRRIGTVGGFRNIRHVVTGPLLFLLVPPDDRFHARIRLAVLVARRAVIEDPHVVRPGPPESRIEAEASGIRARITALRHVLSARKYSGVNPATGCSGAVRFQVGDPADEIALLEPAFRIVAQREAIDLLQ